MKLNKEKKLRITLLISISFIVMVTILGYILKDKGIVTDLTLKNQPPTLAHPFGTDWLGRDMLSRTIAGLSLSIRLGIITALFSGMVAFILGTLCGVCGRWIDKTILFFIDLVMGVPHILLLILISFACGKGFFGIIIGITLTHWMALARIIRSEILQLRESGFILVAKKMGVSNIKIIVKHMVPHLLPQFVTGVILLFPHTILHEASITFLGFGLPPEEPAIGVILSESMKYLVIGKWWLAVLPGAFLVITVFLFHKVWEQYRKLIDPSL